MDSRDIVVAAPPGLPADSPSEAAEISSQDALSPPHSTPVRWIYLLGGLLLACYYPMMIVTFRFVAASDDMAYGLFAPLTAAYVAWDRRKYLLFPRFPSSAWSLVFLGLGAALGVTASMAQSSTFSRFGFLLSLTGCLLLAGGWNMVNRFLFPVLILLFTFPIPEVLYAQITQPLQGLATDLAEGTFEMLSYSVLREGNVLQLGHMNLSIVEACSGLRSLITLFFFCIVYTHFFETAVWIRAVVVLLAIPSAIAVNALRITGTGVLGKYNLAWTQGTYHSMLGWFAFLTGFMLVLFAHKAIVRLTENRRLAHAA